MKASSPHLWVLSVLIAAAALGPGVDKADDTTQSTPEDADPYLSCVRKLAVDPEFAELSKKLPLFDMTTITFAMLADNSHPTPQERKELLAWFDKRDQCWKDGEPLHARQWPPEIFQLSQEGNAELHDIGLDLYNGKATFGETNKRIQDYGNSIRARLVPIIKQYQAEIAAQKAASEKQAQQRQESAQRQAALEQANANAQYAQEQAQRQQRAQMFLNYMQAMRPPQLQVPQMQPMPKTYNSNCTTNGQNTTCVTQ